MATKNARVAKIERQQAALAEALRKAKEEAREEERAAKESEQLNTKISRQFARIISRATLEERREFLSLVSAKETTLSQLMEAKGNEQQHATESDYVRPVREESARRFGEAIYAS
jgi:hypothetical protein